MTCKTILTLAGTIKVKPASRFKTVDFFVEGEKFFLEDNFKTWFLGKTEEWTRGEVSLSYCTLEGSFSDKSLVSELGGEAKAETSLAEVYCLIKAQAGGEKGTLLSNGVNIFFVRDSSGVLRVVNARHFGTHWDIRAHQVGLPKKMWHAGVLVFSRT